VVPPSAPPPAGLLGRLRATPGWDWPWGRLPGRLAGFFTITTRNPNKRLTMKLTGKVSKPVRKANKENHDKN
jgi:hypothetical protein